MEAKYISRQVLLPLILQVMKLKPHMQLFVRTIIVTLVTGIRTGTCSFFLLSQLPVSAVLFQTASIICSFLFLEEKRGC